MDFDKYFQDVLSNYDRMYYNFIGINRKDFPKWEGWKIINSYKEQGVDIKEIEDDRLNILVRNFHYLKFLSETT